MTTRGELLRARFPDAEHKTFRGRGGMALTYIEDETVMGRLDEVLGLGAWQWKVESIDGYAVRGALLVRWDEGGEWTTYQDFGYPTNADGGEPLKEASTDAFRRCARLIGIARYVYAGDLGGPSAPSPRPAPSPVVVPTAAAQTEAVPVEGPPLDWDDIPSVAETLFDAKSAMEGICPEHRVAWHYVPAGVSKKTGQPYSGFWGCSERGCRNRPSIAWIGAQSQ
jgi:hypothetical protein